MKALRFLKKVFMTTIMDFENLFSNDQAVTASAASTNYVDLGVGDQRSGADQTIVAVVTEDFATLTSLNFRLQTDDNTSFSSATDVLITGEVAVADLVAGKKVEIPVPQGLERYARLYYTVTGTNASAGKIKSGIVLSGEAPY